MTDQTLPPRRRWQVRIPRAMLAEPKLRPVHVAVYAWIAEGLGTAEHGHVPASWLLGRLPAGAGSQHSIRRAVAWLCEHGYLDYRRGDGTRISEYALFDASKLLEAEELATVSGQAPKQVSGYSGVLRSLLYEEEITAAGISLYAGIAYFADYSEWPRIADASLGQIMSRSAITGRNLLYQTRDLLVDLDYLAIERRQRRPNLWILFDRRKESTDIPTPNVEIEYGQHGVSESRSQEREGVSRSRGQDSQGVSESRSQEREGDSRSRGQESEGVSESRASSYRTITSQSSSNPDDDPALREQHFDDYQSYTELDRDRLIQALHRDTAPTILEEQFSVVETSPRFRLLPPETQEAVRAVFADRYPDTDLAATVVRNLSDHHTTHTDTVISSPYSYVLQAFANASAATNVDRDRHRIVEHLLAIAENPSSHADRREPEWWSADAARYPELASIKSWLFGDGRRIPTEQRLQAVHDRVTRPRPETPATLPPSPPPPEDPQQTCTHTWAEQKDLLSGEGMIRFCVLCKAGLEQ